MDGYGDAHDRTRMDIAGNGTFKVIEKNIALLKENGVFPFILATLSDDTIEYLPELTKWLLDNRLFSRYNFVQRLDYSRQDYERFCGNIVNAVSKSANEIQAHEFGPYFALKWKISNLSFMKPIVRQACAIADSHIVIDHRWKLALCPTTLDESIGVLEEGIFANYDRYKMQYRSNEIKNQFCRKCRWLRVCGTGCPILNEKILGHPNERSPFCSAYHKLIPIYIDLYGWALEQLDLKTEKVIYEKQTVAE